MTKLEVVIDDLTNLALDRRFEYIPDPSFKCLNETPKSLQRYAFISPICTNIKTGCWWIDMID